MDCCRICSLADPEMFSFSDIVNDKTLAEMFQYCTKIEINEHDGLPFKTCSKCQFDLIEAYEFIIRCHKSDTSLRTKLLENNEGNDTMPDELSYAKNTIKSETIIEDTVLYSDEFSTEPLLNSPNTELMTTEQDDDEWANDSSIEKGLGDNSDDNSSEESDDSIMLNISNNRFKKDQEPKRCCKCKIKLKTISEVRKHSKDVHESSRITSLKSKKVRPYECNVCFNRYKSKRSLESHKQQLYIENDHKCNQCDESFITEELLNRHTESHHRIPRCCGCFEQFETEDLLKKHAKEVHVPEILASGDKTKPYTCELCHRSYKQKSHLKEHQLKPYRRFQHQCAKCGKRFHTRSLMHDHERIHQDTESFRCPKCPKKFAMKTALQRHVRHHTLPDDLFKCETCGKGCKTKGNLQRHTVIHNPDYRPIGCPLCPATFTLNTCLQSHMTVHTGIKPYKCDACDAAYAFPNKLRQHIMVQHEGVKPFKCNVCDRAYVKKRSLKKHMVSFNH